MSKKIISKDWRAWNNLMPPQPFHFHVVGEVQVPNPGVLAVLYPRVPQGINAAILLLELHLVQQPGVWPQHVTWAQAGYNKVIPKKIYEQVTISNDGGIVKTVPVKDVQ
jgi:hypothetical protein